MLFADREDAGRRLAVPLRGTVPADALVLGLPRGGVPVASAVARTLGLPLDVVVVRKLGVPFQPELAFGAIGEGGVRVLDDEVVRRARLGDHEIEDIAAREAGELDRRAALYRGGRPPRAVRGRPVVVVDDGVATGSTARAACRVVRAAGASHVTLAVPVGPPDAAERLTGDADVVVCLHSPAGFAAVGEWYADFRQTTDERVMALLRGVAVPSPVTGDG